MNSNIGPGKKPQWPLWLAIAVLVIAALLFLLLYRPAG